MQKRQTSVERDTINYLDVSQRGEDHELVSSDRHGVIPMLINTSYSDNGLQTMH